MAILTLAFYAEVLANARAPTLNTSAALSAMRAETLPTALLTLFPFTVVLADARPLALLPLRKTQLLERDESEREPTE